MPHMINVEADSVPTIEPAEPGTVLVIFSLRRRADADSDDLGPRPTLDDVLQTRMPVAGWRTSGQDRLPVLANQAAEDEQIVDYLSCEIAPPCVILLPCGEVTSLFGEPGENLEDVRAGYLAECQYDHDRFSNTMRLIRGEKIDEDAPP